MRIPVKFPHYSDDLGQWVLVVLQGELLPEEVGHPCAAGPFGELSWAEPEEGESEGKVQLIVGSHILFGRVEELKEPFLLFKKVVRKRDKFEFDDSDDSDAEAENAPVQLKAQGVIKVQIVFNTPPRPVISTPTEGEVLGTTADPQQDVSSTQSMTRRKVKRLKKTPVKALRVTALPPTPVDLPMRMQDADTHEDANADTNAAEAPVAPASQ